VRFCTEARTPSVRGGGKGKNTSRDLKIRQHGERKIEEQYKMCALTFANSADSLKRDLEKKKVAAEREGLFKDMEPSERCQVGNRIGARETTCKKRAVDGGRAVGEVTVGNRKSDRDRAVNMGGLGGWGFSFGGEGGETARREEGFGPRGGREGSLQALEKKKSASK